MIRKTMNNPGIFSNVWEQLRDKWRKVEKDGYKLDVQFRLIVNESDEEKTLAIDVIQKIDDEFLTETVERVAGEAYETLGISGLSIERLVEVYKEKLHTLHNQLNMPYAYLVVTMTLSSPVSGEVKAYLEKRKKKQKSSIQVDYQHYYLLNALRDKMIEIVGDGWSQVKAVYWQGALEFYFEY